MDLYKMVHAIRSLKCRNGHILPISFDENNCGCHHNGKPCIIITCHQCLDEALKGSKEKLNIIQIPLDEDGLKEIKELL